MRTLYATLLFCLLLASGSVRAAEPTVEMSCSGAETGATGTVTFTLHPNGLSIAAVVFFIEVPDDGTITLPGGEDQISELGAVPPGWDPPYVVRSDVETPPGTKIYGFVTVTGDASSEDPLEFSIVLEQHGAGLSNSPIRLIPYDGTTYWGSHVATGMPEFEAYGITATIANMVNGSARSLGQARTGNNLNAASAGLLGGTGVVAVASGTTLRVLDAVGLKDHPSFPAGVELGSPVDGRQAVAQDLVAVGTRNGRGLVLRADGSTVADVSFGQGSSVRTAPAILTGGLEADVYWTVQTAGGPVLAHSRGARVDTFACGEIGDMVLSSPAVLNGHVIFGTSRALWNVALDPDTGMPVPLSVTPATGGADFSTSPVVDRDGTATIGAADGSVYRLNAFTGGQSERIAGIPVSAAPLSDPFIAEGGRAVLFGGHDGTLYVVRDGRLEPPVRVGSAPLRSPVVVGGDTIVAEERGVVTRIGEGRRSIDLGLPLGKALVAVGTGSDTRLITNSTTGEVYSLNLD